MSVPHQQEPAKVHGDAPVAVLGLGNRLLTDEGAGVAAAEEIASLGLTGTDVLDGGTLGLALLPAVEGRESLLILDAVTARDGQPGDVLILTGDTLRCGWRRCLSAHELGITDALALAALAGRAPARVTAVAMVPASLDTGWGLSSTAQQALPVMVAAARAVLRSWGIAGA